MEEVICSCPQAPVVKTFLKIFSKGLIKYLIDEYYLWSLVALVVLEGWDEQLCSSQYASSVWALDRVCAILAFSFECFKADVILGVTHDESVIDTYKYNNYFRLHHPKDIRTYFHKDLTFKIFIWIVVVWTFRTNEAAIFHNSSYVFIKLCTKTTF